MAVEKGSTGAPASAVQKYVRTIDRPQSGAPLTVYILEPGLKRAQRLEVLAELRGRYPNIAISMVGDEIAVFAATTGGLGS